MIKKIALSLLVAAGFCAAAAAQQAPAKVVLVVREYDNELRFNMAVWRAVQLKQAGVDVTVLFEREGVLNLLPEQGGVFARDSVNSERAAVGANRGRNRALYGARKGRALLKELARLKVPQVVCSVSAVSFGKYDELKAAGYQMSPDPERWVDLVPYEKSGAQLLFF